MRKSIKNLPTLKKSLLTHLIFFMSHRFVLPGGHSQKRTTTPRRCRHFRCFRLCVCAAVVSQVFLSVGKYFCFITDFFLQNKKYIVLLQNEKNISFSSNARTCGVNLKDIFYSTGSMAVIEYWIFFAFFFCFVTPTNIFTLSK